MAVLNINPTRMALTGLKKQLKTALRGHKLLKDKRDELMKQFLDIVKQNKLIREKVEKLLFDVSLGFSKARAAMGENRLEASLMYPIRSVELSVETKNIMSVNVPKFIFEHKGESVDISLPYGLAMTDSNLDSAIISLAEAFSPMLQLAECEQAAKLLSYEIEKTRRRVNALEHVMIPNLQDTIKSITMKLEENERGNLTRLMKVKDMMVKEMLLAKKRGQEV